MFSAIGNVSTRISRLRDFTRSCSKTSVRMVSSYSLCFTRDSYRLVCLNISISRRLVEYLHILSWCVNMNNRVRSLLALRKINHIWCCDNLCNLRLLEELSTFNSKASVEKITGFRAHISNCIWISVGVHTNVFVSNRNFHGPLNTNIHIVMKWGRVIAAITFTILIAMLIKHTYVETIRKTISWIL